MRAPAEKLADWVGSGMRGGIGARECRRCLGLEFRLRRGGRCDAEDLEEDGCWWDGHFLGFFLDRMKWPCGASGGVS